MGNLMKSSKIYSLLKGRELLVAKLNGFDTSKYICDLAMFIQRVLCAHILISHV